MSASQLCKMITAIASLAKNNRDVAQPLLELLPVMADQARWLMSDMSNDEIADIVLAMHTLSTANCDMPELLGLLSCFASNFEDVVKDLSTTKVVDLVMATAVISKNNHDAKILLPALAGRVEELVTALTSKHFSRVIKAMAMMQNAEPFVLKLLPVLAARLKQFSNLCTADQIANLIMAMETLCAAGYDVRDQLDLLLPVWSNRPREFDQFPSSLSAERACGLITAIAFLSQDDAARPLLNPHGALEGDRFAEVSEMTADQIHELIIATAILAGDGAAHEALLGKLPTLEERIKRLT